MEEKLRQFVFNGLLLQDSFETLEKQQGIAVTKSGDLQPVSRVVEADFSPIVWNNACNMSSVYQAIFVLKIQLEILLLRECLKDLDLNGGMIKFQQKLKMMWRN